MKLKLLMNRFVEIDSIEVPIQVTTQFDPTGVTQMKKVIDEVKSSFKTLYFNDNSSKTTIPFAKPQSKSYSSILSSLKTRADSRISDYYNISPNQKYDSTLASLKEQVKDYNAPVTVKDLFSRNDETIFDMTKKYDTLIDKFKDSLPAIQSVDDKLKDTFRADQMTELQSQTKEAVAQFLYMNKELDETGNSSKRAESGLQRLSKLLKSSLLVQIQALAHTLRRIFHFVEESFVAAGDYVESINLYTMSVGEYAVAGQQWAEKISDALYLDTSEIYQYTGQFYNLTRGLGATAKAADLMSRNLTQLTYDMSSYLNIDVSVANNKLMSAMSGQTKAVTSVGIAVQAASLQELAYSLGIDKAVESMTQAEKTYLRYIQIMRTTTQMQGDLGRTIITPTNTMRLLRTQLNLLSRAIGQVFTPIIMNALPYVIAFTQSLTELATWLAGQMGYHLEDYLAPADSIKTLSDNFKDLGYAAKGAGDKINRTLAPFDELNVVQKTTSGSGAGVDDSVLDQLEQYLTGYDMLEFYTTQMKDKINSIKDSLKDVLEVAKVLVPVLGGLWAIGKLNKFADALKGLFITTKGGKTLFGALSTSMGKTLKGAGEGATKMQTLATNIAKVGTGLVALGAGIKLAEDGMYKLGKETGNTTVNLLEFGGGLVSATTGGALIGSVFGPVGTIIGGLGGLLFTAADGWQKFKKGQDEARLAVAEKDVFGDLVISTQEWTNMLNKMAGGIDHSRDKLDELSNTISTTKDSFDKGKDAIDRYLYQFSIMGDKISEEDGQKFKDALDQLFTDANTIVDTSSEEAYTLVSNSLRKSTHLTEEEQQNVLNSIKNNGETKKKRIKGIEDKVYDIYENGLKDRGYLTNEEKKQIQELMDKIDEITTRAATQTETNLLLSQKDFNTDSEENAKESYTNLAESAEAFGKERHDTAQKNYNQLLNLAKSNAYDELVTLKEKYSDIGDLLDRTWKAREDGDEEGYDKLLDELYDYNVEAAEGFQDLWNTRVTLENQAFTSYTKEEEEWKKTVNKAYDDVTDSLAKKYYNLLLSNESNALDQRRVIENTLKGMNVDWSEFEKKVKGQFYNIGYASGSFFASGTQAVLSKLAFDANLKTGGALTGSAFATFATLTFKQRAVGGFPDEGEFFVAREDGPEMVGKIGRRTAVANNDQITTAMTNAMIVALDNINTNNKQPIQNTIYIGTRKVFDGMNDYVDSENDRYGTNYVRV